MNTYQEFLQKKHDVKPINDFRELVYENAERFGNRPAFQLRERVISYNSLKMDYQALCSSFIDKGYEGKRIAVIGANSYEWILTYLAAATVGVIVPVDKELSYEDMDNFIEAAECAAVVADKKIVANVQVNTNVDKYAIAKESDITTVAQLVEAGCTIYAKGTKDIDNMLINPEDLHILIFTSGTTGSAKGVCLSQKNVCANIYSIASMVRIDSSRHTLSVLPLHHTYEATIGHLLILSGGGCISYCDGLRYVGKNITEYHPSVIVAVPLLLEFMMRTIDKSIRKGLPEKYVGNPSVSLSSLLKSLPAPLRFVVRRKVKKSLGGNLKLLIVGAAAIKPDIIETFALLGITTYQGYGLTECAPLLAGNNDFYMNIESVGLPIHGVEIKIENPNEEGVGEIVAKGDNIMMGYYNDPEGTEQIMQGGWFHTGDLGRFDEEGFLYITGRCKNVIVTRNGKNIYPEELEDRLMDEAVIEEAVVVGVPSLRGDDISVKAKIYPNMDMINELYQGTVHSKDAITQTVKDVVEQINDRQPHYKRITLVEVVWEPFEKTTTKKIKRYGDNLK